MSLSSLLHKALPLPFSRSPKDYRIVVRNYIPVIAELTVRAETLEEASTKALEYIQQNPHLWHQEKQLVSNQEAIEVVEVSIL